MEFYVDNVDNSVYNSVFLKKRGFRMWITFLKKIIFVCFFVRDFVALCILLNSSARPKKDGKLCSHKFGGLMMV